VRPRTVSAAHAAVLSRLGTTADSSCLDGSAADCRERLRLLAPKHRRRINACRPTHREVRSNTRRGNQDEGSGEQCRWIQRAHFLQQGSRDRVVLTAPANPIPEPRPPRPSADGGGPETHRARSEAGFVGRPFASSATRLVSALKRTLCSQGVRQCRYGTA
jgi:hypothetical protein